MNLAIEFDQARLKHTFFNTRMRGYLVGSNKNADTFLPHLRELGDWIVSLATNYHLTYSELQEANYLHNEMADKASKVIRLTESGKESEAKEKFLEVEAIGIKFIKTLDVLENKVSKL